MPWNSSMPATFTDGNVVSEIDLDPVVENLTFVRYAKVFLGGVRRVTQVTGITTTESAVMQTPSVTFENGYLYQIEGALKFSTVAAVNTKWVELRLHEGAGLAGAVVQSFGTHLMLGGNVGHQAPITYYIKTTSPITRPYTLGIRCGDANAGTVVCEPTSWLAIVRASENALLIDV